SVGTILWGHQSDQEVSIDHMLLACQAVRRGVTRALVSCDVPFRSLQAGTEATVRDARRLIEEGGADLVKIDAAASSLAAIGEVIRAGIAVWPQFGVDPAAPMK